MILSPYEQASCEQCRSLLKCDAHRGNKSPKTEKTPHDNHSPFLQHLEEHPLTNAFIAFRTI